MPDFTIEGRRIKNLPDVQRTWLWEFVVSNIGDLIDIGADNLEDDLIIRARSCTIPGRGIEIIPSNFMGMQQLFAGRPTFDRAITVNFEETEDQLMSKFLYDWNQAFYDVVPGGATAGVARAETKRELTRTVYLNMYHFGGTNDDILERRVKFWNAWPSTVADVGLNYETSDSVKYDVTFSFDFWTLEATS